MPTILALSLTAMMPAQAGTAQEGAASAAVYDADRQHLWNRLHCMFYVRHVPLTGLEHRPSDAPLRVDRGVRRFGPDVLDPPLSAHPRYLLDDEPFERAVAVLDEFLRCRGGRMIDDPLRRVMLQRDLWAVFDLLHDDPNESLPLRMPVVPPYPPRSAAQNARAAELARKLAAVIRALAVPRELIERLPDNYQAATAGGSASTSRPEAEALPADLFSRAGLWVEIALPASGRDVPVHTRYVRGRSVFRTFYSLDERDSSGSRVRARLRAAGRATKPTSEPAYPAGSARGPTASAPAIGGDAPWPVGTRFVLLRQALALDERMDLVPTPITESMLIRRLVPNPDRPDVPLQTVAEFHLDRADLFAGRAGGLRAVDPAERRFDAYADLGWLRTDAAGRLDEGRPLPGVCLSCHGPFPLGLRLHRGIGLRNTADPSPAEQTINWKSGRAEFLRLREAAAASRAPSRPE